MGKTVIIFLAMNLNMCLGNQKSCLNETVLLSTYNKCFGLEEITTMYNYILLSGGLVCIPCTISLGIAH